MEFLSGIEMVGNGLVYCWAWFVHVMDRAGATGWWLAAIFTTLVYRFFLSPLVGGSGSSDQAKKSGKKAK